MKTKTVTVLDKEVMRYYADQHSIKETAEKFGISTERVKYLAKRDKVSNGRSKKEICSENGRTGNERQSREAENRLSLELLEHGFGYIGGYTQGGNIIKVSHLECGRTFERHPKYFRRYGYNCPFCKKEEQIKEREQRQRREELEKKNKTDEQKNIRLLEKIKKHDARLDELHICSECGKEYSIREYMKSTGTKYERNSGFCSAECRDNKKRRAKHLNRKEDGNHRKRARKFGRTYERGITLRKVVDRFGLTCSLCGEPCDWNDHSWSEYCGPLYPSIDHIIPLCKGGNHEWSNVQVAHIICNSKKETSIIDEIS